MALDSGTRIGPYEIVAKLGEGGMGEVYRATDSHLKRAVAIKILSASVAGDADRLARFKRCLLYTSDAADERSSVDLGGRRIIKKKKHIQVGRRGINNNDVTESA